MARIVDTENFGMDYPNETFVLGDLSEEAAEAITKVINEHCSGEQAERYWKVVDNDYRLKPGFEP